MQKGVDRQDEIIDVSSLALGIWICRAFSRRRRIFLLLLHSRQQFVFAVTRLQGEKHNQHRFREVFVKLHARLPSPFHSTLCDKSSVLCFELDWAAICGLDYSNSLCLDGRVVLESRHLLKREFHELSSALRFYSPRLALSGLTQQPKERADVRASTPNLQRLQPYPIMATARSLDQDVTPLQSSSRQCRCCSSSNFSDGTASLSASLPSEPAHRTEAYAREGPPTVQLLPNSLPKGSYPPPPPQLLHSSPQASLHSPERLPRQRNSQLEQWKDASSKPTRETPGFLSPGSVRLLDRLAETSQGDRLDRLKRNSLERMLTWRSGRSAAGTSAGESPQRVVRGFVPGMESLSGEGGSLPPAAAVQRREGEECVQYRYRTVAFTFASPQLPVLLRPVIQGDERLLKLYESGLPSWAIYLPLYGVYYRPFLRRVTYAAFLALSIFSLCMGCYDLLKHVPFLKQVLTNLASSLFLPTADIFAWLDAHVQMRLSILCSYLFSQSQLAVVLLRWLSALAAAVKEALQPLATLLGPSFEAMRLFLGGWGASFWAASAQAATFLASSLAAAVGPPLALSGQLASFLRDLVMQGVLPLWKVLKLLLSGPVTLAGSVVKWAVATWQLCQSGLYAVAAALAASWQAIKASLQVAPAVQHTAADLSAASWLPWWSVYGSEAVEVIRVSATKTVRALQTLANTLAYWGSAAARHRLTLELRARRQWRATKSNAARKVRRGCTLVARVFPWRGGMSPGGIEPLGGDDSPSGEGSPQKDFALVNLEEGQDGDVHVGQQANIGNISEEEDGGALDLECERCVEQAAGPICSEEEGSVEGPGVYRVSSLCDVCRKSLPEKEAGACRMGRGEEEEGGVLLARGCVGGEAEANLSSLRLRHRKQSRTAD